MTLLHSDAHTTGAPRTRSWLMETIVVVALLAFGYFVLMLDTVPRPATFESPTVSAPAAL